MPKGYGYGNPHGKSKSTPRQGRGPNPDPLKRSKLDYTTRGSKEKANYKGLPSNQGGKDAGHLLKR